MFTIDSGFNDTNTDLKFIESDSEMFPVLVRIRDKPQFKKSQKSISHITNKNHHRINRL